MKSYGSYQNPMYQQGKGMSPTQRGYGQIGVPVEQQQPPPAPQQFANVYTGVQARPVYSPQQTQAALQNYQNFRPSGAAGEAYDQLAPLAQMNSARGMASGNANQELLSQTAQGAAGNRWGSMAVQNSSLQNQQQLQRQQMAMMLMRQLGVM